VIDVLDINLTGVKLIPVIFQDVLTVLSHGHVTGLTEQPCLHVLFSDVGIRYE